MMYMHMLRKIVLFLFSVFFASTAMATTDFYVGGIFGHHLYSEGQYMEQRGTIYGSTVRFQYYGQCDVESKKMCNEVNLYTAAGAAYRHKDYTYYGHLTNLITDVRTPYQFDGSQEHFSGYAQIGAAFNFREIGDDRVILYTGAHYERFDDRNDKYTEYGYRRIRDTVYWTFGAKYMWKIGDHKITPELKSGTSVYSRNLSKVQEDVIHIQKEAALFEIAVQYEYGYVWAQPYFKYQHYSSSEGAIEHIPLMNGRMLEMMSVEPENTSHEFGVRFGIKF